MLLLGVVQSINEMYLDIALPGKMRGRVAITSISGPYSKLLEKVVAGGADNQEIKPLDKMFKKGQYISTKVVSLTDSPKYITLSVSPSDINGERYHGHLQKGLVIVGAVSAIEDHGYTLDTGIKNVRAFLPVEKTKVKFSIGSLVYGCVDELTTTATTSTIILKTNKGNDIGMLEIGVHDPVLDLLLPGTVVPFTMTKILKNGLQGTIFETFVSYVNENYLTEPLHRPNDYTIGLQFDSRILYVMPLTKHVALTMNFSKVKFDDDEGILPIGHVVESAVSLGQSSGAILFKINKTSKGIVTLKSIKSKYKSNYDERTALLAYGKTTKHRLRILSYNAFERVYICTDKEQLLNEPYFSVNDLSPGEVVEAKVGKVLKGKDNGIAVKVGQIKGYIHNLDCSGQFKKGMKTKARVLYVDPDDKTVLLTNRPEFLKAQNVLATMDQARVDDVFTGLIVKDSPALYLVRFYNKLKGVVFKDNTGAASETSELKVGIVTNFRISDIQGERIVLKVATDIDSSDHLGTVVSAKIESIYPTGAQIKIKRLNLIGNIPINYFSDFPVIAEAVFNSFREGQKVKTVNIMNQIFSVRDVDYYSQSPPLTLKDTQVGDILKGTVQSYENGIIKIVCPLKDFRLPVKLHVNKILSTPLKKFDDFELKSDTPIYVRVESKLSKPKTLVVSAKLENVWNGNSNASVSLMQQYFRDLDRIKVSCEARKKPIAKHYVGETVSGTITEKFDTHDILILTLADGISAICRNLITKIHNVGDKVSGKIVWIDYVRQVVDLVTNPKAMACINEDQTVKDDFLNDKTRCKGHVILVRDDIIVVSVGDKGPLVYVATRFHLNDYQPTLINSLGQYGKCTVHLLKTVEGRVIGMFEDNFKQCQEFMKVYEKKFGTVTKQALERKRKREECETEKQEEGETDDQMEQKSILMVKKADNETQNIPKRKKKKHLKANGTENIIAEQSSSIVSKKRLKKKVNHKNKSNIDIENMFKNQLDGPLDFERISKKSRPEFKAKDKKKDPQISSQTNTKTQAYIKRIKKFLVPRVSEVVNKKTETVKEKHLKNKSSIELHIPDSTSPTIEVKTVKNKKLLSMKYEPSSKPTDTKAPLNPNQLSGAIGFWSSVKKSEPDNDEVHSDSENFTNTGHTTKFSKNSEPKSVRDFDRLLMVKPDDSQLWIKYMLFHMKSFEVEKAKGVGQRAIKVINYRNEKDKLNVWMELLKLEINHGTNESFNAVFREAKLRNHPLKVYSKTLPILIEADKLPQVNGLLGPMLKKYKPHPEMWLIAAETYYRTGATSTAKELLDRAYKSLPKDERKSANKKSHVI